MPPPQPEPAGIRDVENAWNAQVHVRRIWVTGTIKIDPITNQSLAEIGYSMRADLIEPV